jgi:hypothetical protein
VATVGDAERGAVILAVTMLSQELLFEPENNTFLGQHVLDSVDVESLSVRIEQDRIVFVVGVRGRWESFKGRSGTSTFWVPRSDSAGLRESAARHVETFLVELAEDLQSPGSPSSCLDWHPTP